MKSFQSLLLVFAMIVLAMAVTPVRAQGDAPAYSLGPDDVIQMTVFGEKDLSGDYKVGADGTISVPLIGTVLVAGLDPAGAEKILTQKFSDGYLVDPSVSIQVSESRPFYILGEVKNPGSYKYVSNMTALNAVALAGGFTYRASEGSVKITRGAEEIKIPAEEKILPGDIVTVKERFF